MVAGAPWEKLPEGVIYMLDKVGYEFGFAFAEAIGEEDRGAADRGEDLEEVKGEDVHHEAGGTFERDYPRDMGNRN
jgi:hypothetical protein